MKRFAALVIVVALGATSLAAQAQARRIAEVFDTQYELALLMRIEVALAAAQADHGVIPREAAEAIARSAARGEITPAEVAEERRKVGHPLVALVNVWARKLPGGAGEWVHHGATTADIFDTMYMLQLRESAQLVLRDMSAIEASMMKLAEAHRATPMMGRTIGRHALPMTFGLKVSSWLMENRRNIERIKGWLARTSTGNISGAVGSYAALGDKAFVVEADALKRLGLAGPQPVDWKGSRDMFAEYGALLALSAKTYARIAQEIFILQGDDIRELEVPSSDVGSSTMPHKVNPFPATRLLTAARTVPRHAEVLQDWMVSIHERDQISSGATLKDLSLAMAQVLDNGKPLLATLVVHPRNMARNLGNSNGLVMAEHAMFLLGAKIGKHTAHDVVHELSLEAWRSNRSLRQVIEAHPEVSKHLTREQVERELDPARYVGLSAEVTDRTLAAVRAARAAERF